MMFKILIWISKLLSILILFVIIITDGLNNMDPLFRIILEIMTIVAEVLGRILHEYDRIENEVYEFIYFLKEAIVNVINKIIKK